MLWIGEKKCESKWGAGEGDVVAKKKVHHHYVIFECVLEGV